MVRLSREKFLSGFQRESFLGSAYPQLRQAAPRLDKRMGTSVSKQFLSLPESKGSFYKRLI